MPMIHSLTSSTPSNAGTNWAAAFDPWARLRPLISEIERRHAEYDDAESPRLTESVIQGTRKLICRLDSDGEKPPTLMTGTCDATIVFEWHDTMGDQAFRSLEVLNDTTAEEYIKFVNGQSTLRTVDF
jgi:hypothetical protein